MKFHHDTPYSKRTKGQKPFLYIGTCHNSMIDYRYLPINNPKRDIVETMHMQNLNEIRLQIHVLGSKVQTDVERTTDERTDGHTDDQCENII